MRKVFVPTNSLNDWRMLLANPIKHWKSGYSAKSLACCWMLADGFPECVRDALNSSVPGAVHDIEMLIALPEYQVALDRGKRATQCDIMVLARGEEGNFCISVEGKADEKFGHTVADWNVSDSESKKRDWTIY